MGRVREPDRERLLEDRGRFFERDAVLGEVFKSLGRMPNVPRHHSTVETTSYSRLNT